MDSPADTLGPAEEELWEAVYTADELETREAVELLSGVMCRLSGTNASCPPPRLVVLTTEPCAVSGRDAFPAGGGSVEFCKAATPSGQVHPGEVVEPPALRLVSWCSYSRATII